MRVLLTRRALSYLSYLTVESLYMSVERMLFIRIAKNNCRVRWSGIVNRPQSVSTRGVKSTSTHRGKCRHTQRAVNPSLLH